MRQMFLLPAFLLLAGCDAAGYLAAGTGASLVTMQRTPVDAVYSLITGRDCSVVHAQRNGEYCRDDPPPEAVPYCTRSLGTVDCWTARDPFGARQQEVADGRRELTPAQERNRTRRWPGYF